MYEFPCISLGGLGRRRHVADHVAVGKPQAMLLLNIRYDMDDFNMFQTCAKLVEARIGLDVREPYANLVMPRLWYISSTSMRLMMVNANVLHFLPVGHCFYP